MSESRRMEMIEAIRILAISGSLRSVSSNTALLQAVISLAPEDTNIALFTGLGDLPHFNPDLEALQPPAVLHWRSQLQHADGVLICSPEYAHGVPGVLKNALDWVVGTGEFVGKPVALLNASPRSTHAQASLRETIATMAGQIVTAASLDIPLPSNKTDVPGILSNSEIVERLNTSIAAFKTAIEGTIGGNLCKPV